MTDEESKIGISAFMMGILFGVILFFIALVIFGSPNDYVSKKDAVSKGAAVYRIKPGTLNEVEFVWKVDMEK